MSLILSNENNIFPVFIDSTQFGHSKTIETGEILVNLKSDKDKTDTILGLSLKRNNNDKLA